VAEKHWTDNELGGAELGDERRTKRLVRIARQMSKKPGHTMGGAMGAADAKAAYRLFSEVDVSAEAILAPHVERTIERMKSEPVVLIAQDTTVLNYTTHEESDGFGGIGGGYEVNQGCFLHGALALTESGTPLGVLAAKQWSRAKKMEGSERKCWSESVREIGEATSAAGLLSRVVHLADREGDDWTVLSACTEYGASFVVRAHSGSRARVDNDGAAISDTASAAPSLGTLTVSVARKLLRKGKGLGTWKTGNDRPASPARSATVVVSAAAITLPRAANRKNGLDQIQCYVLLVRETGAPKSIKDPLEWLLITDEPVTSLAAAERVIGWYRHRWNIETWHRTLKSGVKVEECRLSTYSRMQRFIALAAILAWRIEWMTHAARENPETPARALLDDVELEALRYSSTPKVEPRTLAEAVLRIAILGGFKPRGNSEPPGSQTVWRGILALAERTDLLRNVPLHRTKKKNVGRSVTIQVRA
jgi:hypothetical protein